jgi:hypothetical protein
VPATAAPTTDAQLRKVADTDAATGPVRRALSMAVSAALAVSVGLSGIGVLGPPPASAITQQQMLFLEAW